MTAPIPQARADGSLVVLALRQESHGLIERAGAQTLYTGVGKVNAAMTLARALAERRLSGQPVARVINFGTAGSTRLARGSLVGCHRFVQADMDATALGFARGETPFDDTPPVLECEPFFLQLPQVTCASGDAFVTDPASVPGDVVEMEAFALARVCRAEGVPFACAKYVTDGADGAAPGDWREALRAAADAFARLYAAYR